MKTTVNPVMIEKALNLIRGDILEVRYFGDKEAEIITSLFFSPAQQTTIASLFPGVDEIRILTPAEAGG